MKGGDVVRCIARNKIHQPLVLITTRPQQRHMIWRLSIYEACKEYPGTKEYNQERNKRICALAHKVKKTQNHNMILAGADT